MGHTSEKIAKINHYPKLEKGVFEVKEEIDRQLKEKRKQLFVTIVNEERNFSENRICNIYRGPMLFDCFWHPLKTFWFAAGTRRPKRTLLFMLQWFVG